MSKGIKKENAFDRFIDKILGFFGFGSKRKKSKVDKSAIAPRDKLRKPVKKRLVKATLKAKRKGVIAETAQETIPYKYIYPDGLCHVDEDYYTRTIEFFEINYKLSSMEEQAFMFEHYCDLLNYFDSSVSFQLTFVNRYGNMDKLKEITTIPLRGDKFDDVASEYSKMIQSQLQKGNNGLRKLKYLTFGIHAKNKDIARTRLTRVETDIIGQFKRFSVKAYGLDGYERIKEMFHILHPDERIKLRFNWDLISQTGLSSKDFIAPSSFTFDKNGRTFKVGGKVGATGFVQIMAAELSDKLFQNILDFKFNQIINFHVQPIDQAKAVKFVKSKLTDIDRMKIDEQRKAFESGYNIDIMPPDITSFGEEAYNLLEALQKKDERLFLVTIIYTTFADNMKKLNDNLFQVESTFGQHQCNVVRLDYQQEEGLQSTLPIGKNFVEIERILTTSSLAIFVPFTAKELFMGGEALYYGLNPITQNLIMIDRKQLLTPNGVILGKSGGGKSFAAKREITGTFLRTLNDIIICDPNHEYGSLVEHLQGDVIKVSVNTTNYINVMDIRLDYEYEANPLAVKAEFILSLCDMIIGGKDGLQPIEKTVIDRCVHLAYKEYIQNPIPGNMPILEDLWNILKAQPEPESHQVANALELYVKGSLNVFNHHTNVKFERVVSFDISELGQELKKIGTLIIQDAVWNRVMYNRSIGKHTSYYIDEMHLLLDTKQSCGYFAMLYATMRKMGGIVTGITQNIKTFLTSPQIQNILDNSEFIIMLSQASGDRQILADMLGVPPSQMEYVKNAEAGHGLIICGDTVSPFVDKFPKHLKLYKIMTTRLSELNS